MPRDKRTPSDASSVGRKLTKLLRHRIHENGLGPVLRPSGYVPLANVLQLPQFEGVSVETVREAVRIDNKQRMSLLEEGRTVFIRANQGHSISGLSDEHMLTPLDEASASALCGGRGRAIHGTYHKVWPAIVASGGLNKMSRTHIHLAQGLPGADGVISGMRSSSEIIIWVDVVAAMKAGIRFFLSANGVVLTAGDADGLLPLRFFASVEDAATRTVWIDGAWRPAGTRAAASCRDACSATPTASSAAASVSAAAQGAAVLESAPDQQEQPTQPTPQAHEGARVNKGKGGRRRVQHAFVAVT